MKKVNYTWEQFDKDVIIFSEWIKKQNKIKAIFAIPNGGLVFGVALANRLKLPLFFKWGGVALHNYNKNEIVIVDDISDSGRTLRRVMYVNHFLTCTLTIKRGTQFVPDCYGTVYDDNVWVSFPWEPQEKECVRDGT